MSLLKNLSVSQRELGGAYGETPISGLRWTRQHSSLLYARHHFGDGDRRYRQPQRPRLVGFE